MRRLLPVLGLLLLAGGDALAKLDGPQWLEAEQRFRQLFAQPGDADGKVAAIKTVEKDGEPRAWKLLSDGVLLEAGHVAHIADKLSKDLANLQVLLGKRQKYPAEEEEMYRLQGSVSESERARAAEEGVVTALVMAFASGTEDARKPILSVARGSKDWPVRAAAARIAAFAPDESSSKATLADALAKESDPRVKLAALDALKKAPGTSWQDLVIGRIEDPDWGVQVVAARIAGDREIGKAIPLLIKALAGCSPRVGEEIVGALRALTGQNMEAYPEPWAKWWEANRSKWGADGRPLQPMVNQPRASDIDFYGLKVKSDKVLYIIDVSGSMKFEKKAPPTNEPPHRGPVTGEPPKKPEEPVAPHFFGPKIEIAKQELRRSLSKLPKETMFDIISFNHGVLQWQPKMVPATEANKELAYAWIRDMTPSGSTYIDGALRLAFKMAGMGAYDKAYPGVGVDTIILLSDGAPTDNLWPESKDMDPNLILGHVAEWNSQRRVVIHCVGIDNVVQGIEFMKKLAAQNGGTYVDG